MLASPLLGHHKHTPTSRKWELSASPVCEPPGPHAAVVGWPGLRWATWDPRRAWRVRCVCCVSHSPRTALSGWELCPLQSRGQARGQRLVWCATPRPPSSQSAQHGLWLRPSFKTKQNNKIRHHREELWQCGSDKYDFNLHFYSKINNIACRHSNDW